MAPDPGPASGHDPSQELVEWVADDGTVIDVVTRARMRAEGLRHRCTYVVVVHGDPRRFSGPGPVELRPGDEIVVHQRADWKDVCPSHWDLAFGGVCGVAESWELSARRELAEEAGIVLGPDDPLVDLGSVAWEQPPGPGDEAGSALVGRTYLVGWAGEPVSADGEAVAFGRVAMADLSRWASSVPVCPDTRSVVVPALHDLLGPGPTRI